MKKPLKIFLIVVLVGAVIATTCFFFFKNLNRNKNANANVASFLTSGQSSEVTEKLNKSRTSYDTSSRFLYIYNTEQKLNSILSTLNLYLIVANDYSVDSNKIVNNLNSLKSKQSTLNDALDEFLLKVKYGTFDKSVGANEVIRLGGEYLVSYANFINIINNEVLSKVVQNSNSDLKFSLINLYKNIVVETFSNLYNSGNLLIYSTTNISKINTNFSLLNGYVKTANTSMLGDHFNYQVNEFIKNYNNSDKQDLAKNFTTYINAATSISDTSTSIQKASYYLKRLLGM